MYRSFDMGRETANRQELLSPSCHPHPTSTLYVQHICGENYRDSNKPGQHMVDILLQFFVFEQEIQR
mgnify:CR=1 FL=1